MNVERIQELAAAIENAEHVAHPSYAKDEAMTGFNMAEWHCGTVGCIGGWAEYLFADEARESLGITLRMASDLFWPDDVGPYVEITPLQAAAVLRNLAATGEVDWSVSP